MPQTIAIVAIIISFLGGGAVGSVITAIVTGCRDKRRRRQAFLGFLRQWHTEISMPRLGPDKLGLGVNAALESYYAKLPSFKAEVERVRDAFADATMYEALTSRLGSLKEEDWKGKQARDVILKTLDELIKFAA